MFPVLLTYSVTHSLSTVFARSVHAYGPFYQWSFISSTNKRGIKNCNSAFLAASRSLRDLSGSMVSQRVSYFLAFLIKDQTVTLLLHIRPRQITEDRFVSGPRPGWMKRLLKNIWTMKREYYLQMVLLYNTEIKTLIPKQNMR